MGIAQFKVAATLKDVMERVVDRRSADPTAAMKRIAEVNPHIDFTKSKIPEGSVLILPDEPGIRRGDKGTAGPEKKAYETLGSNVVAGFEAAAQRVARAVEAADAERAELVAALKSAIVKAQMGTDQSLQKRLGDALAASELRQKELKEAAVKVDLLRKSFTDEFETMEKMYR